MKRKLIIVSVAMALVCAFAVGMTIAYLKDTTPTPVKNTFTVGKIDIKLDETDITKTDGSRTEEGNEYKLFPGMSYVKDPMVTVLKDSEECFVRMRVEFNAKTGDGVTHTAEQIRTLLFETYADYTLPQNYITGWDSSVWVCHNMDTETYALEFWYYQPVEATTDAAEELPKLFTNINVPGIFTDADMAILADLEIDIYADAIQTASFDTMEAAWTAFDAAAPATQNP